MRLRSVRGLIESMFHIHVMRTVAVVPQVASALIRDHVQALTRSGSPGPRHREPKMSAAYHSRSHPS